MSAAIKLLKCINSHDENGAQIFSVKQYRLWDKISNSEARNFLYLFACIYSLFIRLTQSFSFQTWKWLCGALAMADKLVEIERRDWPALRDLYSPNSPATFIAHSAVDTYIRWTNQQPDLPNLAIYSLNGDWSDGSFAAVVSSITGGYVPQWQLWCFSLFSVQWPCAHLHFDDIKWKAIKATAVAGLL